MLDALLNHLLDWAAFGALALLLGVDYRKRLEHRKRMRPEPWITTTETEFEVPEITTTATGDAQSRCPFCRDDLTQGINCAQCSALVHGECWPENGSECPSCRRSAPLRELTR